MPAPLVFILGNHRSGTTWLYQLLAGTGQVSVLTAQAVIARGGERPSPAELASIFAERGIAERQLDGVPITPELPEEYCYVLNNAGFPSWTTRKSLPALRALVDGLAARGRPVVLKNPWDYANFELLAEAFPEARFLFLHRHPYRVVHSALSVFRVMMEAPDAYLALLSERYVRTWERRAWRGFLRWFSRRGLAVHLFAGGVRASNDYFLGHAARLGERAISLRYEDLCANPDAELRRLLRFLDLDAAVPAVPPRPSGGELPPEIRRRAGWFAWQMRAYLQRMGYEAAP